METIWNLMKKYREILLYLVFGVLTTLCNIVSYFALNDLLHIHYLVANALAWVLSVLFAYLTNRTWVFESKSQGFSAIAREMGCLLYTSSFAKALTVKSGDPITQSGLAYASAQWEAMFVSLIWQNGGDYRDEANSVVHFNTPEAKKAAEFMLKYANPADPDVICDIGASRYELFIQGTAAMVMGAPWYAGSLATDAPDMNYQYFNMPAMVEGSDPYCMATGGWGYIVSAESKNKPAAWEFVKQMTTPEQIGSWALGVGSLAAHKAVSYTHLAVYKRQEYLQQYT